MSGQADYQRQAKAGLSLLHKRLEKLAEDASKINHANGATTFHADADTVQAVLDTGKPLPTPEEARQAERVMLRAGLQLLVHNLKAASGTVSALGKTDLADEFRDEATDIETKVLPRLDEQVPLRLEVASGS